MVRSCWAKFFTHFNPTPIIDSGSFFLIYIALEAEVATKSCLALIYGYLRLIAPVNIFQRHHFGS